MKFGEAGPAVAYLLAFVDTARRPPVVRFTGIYSESGDTITSSTKLVPLTVMEYSAHSYAAARDGLLRSLQHPATKKLFSWAYDLLPENHRR